MGNTLSHDPLRTPAPLQQARRARAVRRVGLTLLATICVIAMLGLFGPFETSVEASGQSREVTVTHPRVVRPGMEVELSLTVDRQEPGELEVVVTQELLAALGVDQIFPEPDAQQSDESDVVLTFDDQGDRATVVLTARIPTRSPLGGVHGSVGVRDSGEPASTTVDLTVWVLP